MTFTVKVDFVSRSQNFTLKIGRRVALRDEEQRGVLVARQDQEAGFISHNVFVKSFCISQLPHKSDDSFFTITNIKNEFADLRGN